MNNTLYIFSSVNQVFFWNTLSICMFVMKSKHKFFLFLINLNNKMKNLILTSDIKILKDENNKLIFVVNPTLKAKSFKKQVQKFKARINDFKEN